VIQYAIANKWISDDPFLGKRFKRTKADRGFLTEPELKSIMALDLKAFPRLECVRDTFVFCCFTGLAFIDVKTLKRSDISADTNGNMWIRKNREKTEELSVIPLLDVPQTIMRKYSGHPVVLTTGVVLPVMSNQKVNAYLKEIADLAKISKHLTSHIARHTFATMSLNNHVPLETISKMLGHSDIKTTQIYARLLDNTISEDMEVMRAKFNGVRLG
jgi:site-specific recombinase XerD